MALHHYINVVQTGQGVGLVNWRVQAVTPGTASVQSLYSDSSSTPIVAVSGIANTALTDATGNYNFYIARGTYDLIFYNAAGVFQNRVSNVPMFGDLTDTGGAAQVGFDSTLSYSASTVGKSLADLYGQHQTNAGNPTQDGGLIGLAPDGNSTKAVRRDYTPLTGTRTSAVIANTIEVSDGQSGPASSAGVSTASSASYALSLINVRPSWNTAGTTGEANGVNVFIRQASGDSAAMLGNVGTRSGFGAFSESYTFSADSAGAVVKAINTSIGVVNSRDGGEYGMNVIASAGALTAAYRAQQTGTSTFTDWIQFVNSSGSVVFRVRAADAAILGGTVAPLTDFGGDLGGAAARFSTSYSRYMNVTEGAAASVPTPAAGTQTLFIDSADHKLKRKDSSGTVTVIA